MVGFVNWNLVQAKLGHPHVFYSKKNVNVLCLLLFKIIFRADLRLNYILLNSGVQHCLCRVYKIVFVVCLTDEGHACLKLFQNKTPPSTLLWNCWKRGRELSTLCCSPGFNKMSLIILSLLFNFPPAFQDDPLACYETDTATTTSQKFLFFCAAKNEGHFTYNSDEDKDGVGTASTPLKVRWGSDIFLTCTDVCFARFEWMIGERHLTEVSENWGVLLLTNVTQSNEYTCTAGRTGSTKTYYVKAVGKSETLDFG